jgi:hypothetical protein
MKLPATLRKRAFGMLIPTGQTNSYSKRLAGGCSVKQTEFLQRAIETLEGLAIPYAVVGSWASGFWGNPRMTRDIDVVIRIDAGHVAAILACFPAPEFYVSRSAVEEAIRFSSQFNVIHPTSANKIDFMMSGLTSWGDAQLARRRRVRIAVGCEGYVAAPEDVILGKLLYYREGGSDRHLSDIAGILAKSGEVIERHYLEAASVELGVTDELRLVLDATGD